MISKSDIMAQINKTSLDESLFEELVENFFAIQQAFLKKDYEKTLVKTGKYCETAYQLLEDLTTGNYSTIPSFNDLKEDLEDMDSDTYPDGIRILIPRLGKDVYDLRSRRGAVHKAEMNHMFMDAHLAVQITRWILAELLREYGDYDGDTELLEMYIENITTESLPIVEEFEDGDVMVLVENVSCKEKIMIILYHFYPERVTKKALKEYLNRQSPANVLTSLKNAEKQLYVHTNDNGSKLTMKGKKYVEDNFGPDLEVEKNK